MARNGSDGTFSRLYDWTDDEANAIDITASRFDDEMDGMATALTDSVAKDGQTTMTGNLPMGGNKLTNLADGSALTDSVSLKQVQNSAGKYAVATGSGNAYAIALSPTVTAYATGQKFTFTANHTNSDTATLNVDGVGAKTIKLGDGSTLIARDIVNGYMYTVIYNGTDFVIPNTSRKVEMIGTYIAEADDTDYAILKDTQFAGEILETYTVSTSGTCTATFKIGSTALGGTANSVSSSESTQAHSSSNAVVNGDDLNLTISSNASATEVWAIMYLSKAIST